MAKMGQEKWSGECSSGQVEKWGVRSCQSAHHLVAVVNLTTTTSWCANIDQEKWSGECSGQEEKWGVRSCQSAHRSRLSI